MTNFKQEKRILEYGLVLTPAQENALKYVEGEHNDYTNKQRLMNELAAFCHLCDVTSARIFHSYPLQKWDPWSGRERENRNDFSSEEILLSSF